MWIAGSSPGGGGRDGGPAHEVAGDYRKSGVATPAAAVGRAETDHSLMRRMLASSPTMPRRNSSTQTTKIAPWTTNTHWPIVVR